MDKEIASKFFKVQQDYLKERGLGTKEINKLKLEFCRPQMLQQRGIRYHGLDNGIMWQVWDRYGQATGAVGARVWYKDATGFQAQTGAMGPKFLTPRKQRPRIYHSPLSNWDSPGNTIILCESFLKADIAALCGYKAMGISGIWGWSHNKDLNPDFFDQWDWINEELELRICFDSNVAAHRPENIHAARKLAIHMQTRGAKCTIAYLPAQADGTDQGLDDYYATHGKEATCAILEDSKSIGGSLDDRLQDMNNTVAMVRGLNRIVELETGNLYTVNDFTNGVYANNMVMLLPSTKMVSVPKKWMQWEERNDVTNITYAPGKPQITDGEYNLWTGLGTTPAYDEDLEYLWTSWLKDAFPNPDHRHWFTCWWAMQLQNVGIKMKTALVMVGKSGVGKGWLSKIMHTIFGDANCSNVSLASMGKDFNSDFATKQLAMVEEANMPRNADGNTVYNKLKDTITSTRMRVERKGVDAFYVDNYLNIMLQGNRVDMLRLDDFDRRFAIFDIVNDSIANNEAYWDLRWGSMDQGLPQAVHAWLLEYDTKDFDPFGKAIETETRAVMIDTTHTPREQFVADLVMEPNTVLNVLGTEIDGEVMTAKELEFIYQEGRIPLWDIEKRDADNMARTLRNARVPVANGGKKLNANNGTGSQRYFIVRPVEKEPRSWANVIKRRKYWGQQYSATGK